jgi:hypothetical protein
VVIHNSGEKPDDGLCTIVNEDDFSQALPPIPQPAPAQLPPPPVIQNTKGKRKAEEDVDEARTIKAKK